MRILYVVREEVNNIIWDFRNVGSPNVYFADDT